MDPIVVLVIGIFLLVVGVALLVVYSTYVPQVQRVVTQSDSFLGRLSMFLHGNREQVVQQIEEANVLLQYVLFVGASFASVGGCCMLAGIIGLSCGKREEIELE